MFFSVAVGLLLGVLLVLLVKPPDGFSKHVIVATGLGEKRDSSRKAAVTAAAAAAVVSLAVDAEQVRNAGNLPLVLVSALMQSSGSTLFAGQDVTADLAIAYVAVGIFAATITHFTIGTQMLKAPSSKAADKQPCGSSLASSDSSCWVHLDLREKQQLPMQPSHRSRSSSWWGYGSSSGSSSLSRLQAAGAAARGFVWALASPPLVGCMLAVAVGVLPLLRNQLFSPAGHLLLVKDCIAMFGDCCIPSLMLMLGATLAKGPGRCCPPLRVVLGVTGARLLLLPVLGTGWLLLASKAGWLVAPDSVFLLVLLLQSSVPTALNVHTLATLNSNREEEVGALLFWQYLASCVTTPACLMLFTWLLKTGAFVVAA
ncbi:membrane transport protein-domain-containing protein [Scenedesmus sp. NREL 46B-D3]|nr:membrane transport protein-domain-containing protein [Scenedesmus sp. NREL 46B-D3]